MNESDELDVEVRLHGTTATVVAVGALDIATADDLRRAASGVRDGTRRVVIDLERVGFVDSSGLGTLLNLRADLRRRGIALRVEVGEGPVRRALETTGLGELLAA